MPNYNPTTGIRYGVASANGLAEWFWDEIYAHGVDESAAAALAEWRAEFKALHGCEPDDEFEQIFWDEYECDESERSYNRDGLRLLVGWLGGAPLVWVLESNVRCYTGDCSPCVPGAGDLDHYSLEYDPDGDTYALPLALGR